MDEAQKSSEWEVTKNAKKEKAVFRVRLSPLLDVSNIISIYCVLTASLV
jgi:hypothetical protein